MNKNKLLIMLLLTTHILCIHTEDIETIDTAFNQSEDLISDNNQTENQTFSVPLESLSQSTELETQAKKENTSESKDNENSLNTNDENIVQNVVETSENASATNLTEGSPSGEDLIEPHVNFNVTKPEESDLIDDHTPMMPITDLDTALTQSKNALNTTISMDESETITPVTTNKEEEKHSNNVTINDTTASTTTINKSIPTIQMTTGSVFELATLKNSERYFIKDAEHADCLTSTTDTDGTTIYTLAIQPGMTTDHFTIFKGHGTQASQTDLRPAFHVQILDLNEHNSHTLSAEEKIKKAWKEQEEAEQTFLDDFTKRFDDFRKEVARIWFDLDHKDEETISDKKSITKDHIHLKEGQTEVLATGKSATVQSNNPTIASGKIEHPSPTEKETWNILITGHKSGEAIVRYTVDGIMHKQPIIVQKELVLNNSKKKQ